MENKPLLQNKEAELKTLQKQDKSTSTYVIVLVKELLQEMVTRVIELCGAANGNPQSEQENTVTHARVQTSTCARLA